MRKKLLKYLNLSFNHVTLKIKCSYKIFKIQNEWEKLKQKDNFIKTLIFQLHIFFLFNVVMK